MRTVKYLCNSVNLLERPLESLYCRYLEFETVLFFIMLESCDMRMNMNFSEIQEARSLSFLLVSGADVDYTVFVKEAKCSIIMYR